MSVRIVWCLGMYASGSTWLFNVASQIAALSGTTQTHFISDKTEVDSLIRPNAINIIKSHEINDEETIENLTLRSQRIFVTVRDPRDAVASLMLYHKLPFDRALSLVTAVTDLCLPFAQDKRALFWHYESEFFDDIRAVDLIASHLELPLDTVDRDRIFTNLRRSEVEKYVSQLRQIPGVLQDQKSGDLLDPRTHWHSHHAGRSGEIGRWKKLLRPEQARQVERGIPDYFAQFG